MYPETKTSTKSQVALDEGLRQFMLGVFNNMAFGLALSAVVAYFVGTSPELMKVFFAGPQKWIVILAPLGMIFYLVAKIESMSPSTARTWFYAYAGMMGLSLATVFAVYQMGSIVMAFSASAAMFGSMSLIGYTTKRDLTKMGSFLMMGLIGLIIVMLVNIFVQSSVLATAISMVAVVIFAGLTAWDVQNLREIYYQADGDERERAGVIGALNLYLDFINIFLNILQLIGDRK